ncbi:MAG: PucR family transcriptional regulator ligand-binding domain-containing protein, partial [Actinobacteria bacterium]|nr:PucR family transcriptional regulator ligand-binding domain-containing protein [Actinomycetota bacterium]
MGKRAQTKPRTSGKTDVVDHPILSEVIRNLGEGIVEVLAAPKGLEVPVLHPAIYDPLRPPALEPGDLVLGVGTDSSRPDVLNLIELAGQAGAAGIVIRAPEAVPPMVFRAAEEGGLALLGVVGEISWAQLHALLRNALVVSGEILESRVGDIAAGDLFALANALTGLVGGPVTIEDAQSRVMAYSSTEEPIDEARRQTILGRRVPERFIARLKKEGVFKRLWAGEVVRVEFPGDADLWKPRLAAAVRAGDEVLGSIWVAQGRDEFGPNAVDALHEAADIAALHLIRHRSSDDLERRRRGEMLKA